MRSDSDKLSQKLKTVRELEAQRNHQDVMYSDTSVVVSSFHQKRQEAIAKILRKFAPDSKFLDIGCAEGRYCELAKSFGAKEVVGVDVSRTKIERAAKRVSGCQFHVVDITDAREMKEFYNRFDFILCSEVLQHVLDYRLVTHEIVKCSVGNGLILITAPDYSRSSSHEMAKLSDNMDPQELLREIGGAGFGKQIAIWKFNGNRLERELQQEFPLSIIKSTGVGPWLTKVLRGRSTFKITLFRVSK